MAFVVIILFPIVPSLSKNKVDMGSSPQSACPLGCNTIAPLYQNEAIFRSFEPMSKTKQKAVIGGIAPCA
jgi:hypothetical protein